MKDKSIDYVIGKTCIEKDNLKVLDEDVYPYAHKFIVQRQKGKFALYMMRQPDHYFVNLQFKLDEKDLIGGGLCYIDSKDMLVFGDYSGYYGSIPKEAAQRFAKLVADELAQKGITIKGITVNPNEIELNKFWKKYKK